MSEATPDLAKLQEMADQLNALEPQRKARDLLEVITDLFGTEACDRWVGRE